MHVNSEELSEKKMRANKRINGISFEQIHNAEYYFIQTHHQEFRFVIPSSLKGHLA